MEKKIAELEYAMWEAAARRDTMRFKELVHPNAEMICGGYQCLGSEYAGFISAFDISGYTIRGMEVIAAGAEEAVLHYAIQIEVENPDAKDLEGTFHVVSVWKKFGEVWQLTFNMDSRVPPRAKNPSE